MIFVDSTVVEEMLIGGKDALELSNFLEVEASKNMSIVILDNSLFEAFIRINSLSNKSISPELLAESILRFRRYYGGESLTKNVLMAVPLLIKALPSASAIQIHIAANAVASEGEYLCEQSLFASCPAEQLKKRKISQRFASIKIKI